MFDIVLVQYMLWGGLLSTSTCSRVGGLVIVHIVGEAGLVLGPCFKMVDSNTRCCESMYMLWGGRFGYSTVCVGY
jgi:hypothetical protein